MRQVGLTSTEVEQRITEGKVNRVKRSNFAEYRDIVTRNLFTLFNFMVVPAAIALFVLAEYRGAFAVSGMAIANTILGLAQEIRAKRHLDQLALLAESKALVIRDGQEMQIAAGDIVEGDLLKLKTGESIVADGEVLDAQYLEVDESLLTGESDPVTRKVGEQLYSGSFCVSGVGLYRADRVGADSFAQSTSQAARSYQFTASPIQKSIDVLIRILTATALILCVIYVALYFLRDDIQNHELVQMIAATITSMVPQGLVLMATLAFTLGAVRMSRKGAIVQRLAAVESMAAVTVLCMDKTGTLTTNHLQLDTIHHLSSPLTEDEIRERLKLFASATMDRDNRTVQALEQSLGKVEVELVDQIPFKSQNRYSAVRLKSEGKEYTLAMGACESLGRLLSEDTSNEWQSIQEELSDTGLRLLMFAESSEQKPFNGSLTDFQLQPLALIALSDELRPEAEQVLQHLAEQGIGFKIISGDNPKTVRATVSHLDLPLAHAEVVSGDELQSTEDAKTLIGQRSVFGRVSPEQKVQIVTTLQEQNQHVAMIGDGVNDVLPIKKADLGIAMGAGSQASKTVADIVLENNNFELLPETLEEGRTILRNLRRAAKIFLLKNVYTLILIIGAFVLFSREFPYLPQQVTLLNLLTIGIPAFLITLSRQRSKQTSSTDFLKDVGSFALRTGGLFGLAGLGLFGWASLEWPNDVQMQRTVLLSALVLLGITALLRVLTDAGEETLAGDRHFRWLIFAALPIYALALYVPIFADFFQLRPMGFSEWLVVLAVVVPTFLLCKWTDRWHANNDA